MTQVLHGMWLPQDQRFFIWGETSQPSRRRGRLPASPPHPFQLPIDSLRSWANHLAPHHTSRADQRLTLWLPSVADAPVPSPELLATGVEPVDGQPVLATWQVTGLLLPPAAAVDLLLALAPGRDIGADLRAARLAALIALEIVAQQAVLPTLVRDNGGLRALWRPHPTSATAHRLLTLTRALPPLARAAAADPSQAPSAATLVGDFVTAAADALIRDAPHPPLSAPTTPAGKWLAALVGPDPVVRLPVPEADALYTAWQTWSGQVDVAADAAFRVTFRLEPPDADSAPWRLAYLLQAVDDPSLLVPAASIWRERGAAFTYLDRRFERPQERLLTALGHAARLFPPLTASLRAATPEYADLTTDQAFTFLKEAAPLLERAGFGVLVPNWWHGRGARVQARARIKTPAVVTSGRLNFDSLVNFEWEATLGGEPMSYKEFQRLAALKLPLVQVRGQWVVLDPDHLQQALRFFERRQGQMTLGEALRLGLDGVDPPPTDGVEVTSIEADDLLRDLLDRLSNPQALEVLPTPDDLHGRLRPYQQRGFSWLTFMRRFGLGACLADDMGLGKTVQTIALLLHERRSLGVTAPALLVCPTSVVGNWARELERFAPSLRVMVHRGASRLQSDSFAAEAAAHDIVLTSYPLLSRDRPTLTAVQWSTVVLDEAQNIKNASTKQAQAARALAATTRVALTGTPVENRLTELWSIMAYLNPGYLGSEEGFRRDFARPIERTGDRAATDRLRRLTAPFILRRLKTDRSIIADLPDKLEMKVYCSLTREQATLYQAVVTDAMQAVAAAEGDGLQRRGLVLAMLSRLKQICNHPAQFLKDGSAITGRSGKLARLTEMLEEVYAADDRALVFTQFAEMGHIVFDHLDRLYPGEVLYLHGGTPAKERDSRVRRFQAPSGPRVFILSLRAGGTGLNLTGANHVFHFDRWWNPAVENQATDRAYRIGQTRNVQVHKFICGGTLEDHIDQMIEDKRALAENVLGQGEGWLTELSTETLRDLVTLRRADVSDEEDRVAEAT